MSHRMDVLYVTYSVIFLWAFGLFLDFATTNSATVNILVHVTLFADAIISTG